MNAATPWLLLGALGVYHGVNPAMGWLFAVSRGLQEQSGRAVVRALPPIALGHAASVAGTVMLLALGNSVLSSFHVKVGMALLLIGFGALKLWRPRHPRWVGMRLGFRDLTLWSFVMATAHGAGLMLIPVFLVAGTGVDCGHCDVRSGLVLTSWTGYLAAVTLHTLAMLLSAAAVAWVVYAKLGLGLLRRAWFNADSVWALALVAGGALALVT